MHMSDIQSQNDGEPLPPAFAHDSIFVPGVIPDCPDAASRWANLHSYVGADPINFTDPTGLDACPDGSGDICVTGRRPGIGVGVSAPRGRGHGRSDPRSDALTKLECRVDPTVCSEPGQTPKKPDEQKRRPDFCGSSGSEGIPDGNFAEACAAHDECYATPGNSKAGCDVKLVADITAACSGKIFIPFACVVPGLLYGGGLILDGTLGSLIYNSPSNRAYRDAQRLGRRHRP